ncbi:MAG: tRNA (N(6)-L-threonylcarbamoyladenosine(37)-C(2))-methylthiotransferase MtaB [Clostridiales bacterium]|nr:tRNA (N(6)-L-threonylcarbamoyladenosine(37)-C(2))-methylthiotransferase MtaB [Clostridiales bacterium]
MPKTVCFTTLGCKVNQYDTQAMLEQFEQNGYVVVAGNAPADVCVINTCTVTGTGDKKSLQLVRRFKRRNPQADIVVTGCLAQRMGEELLETGARLILGTQYRGRVVEMLHKAIAEDVQLVAVDTLTAVPYEPLVIHNHEGHTRAVMKIQEGCNNHCTYCIIPSVRGNIRSRQMEDIQKEAMALAEAGFHELVLTGIHLTSFGRDLPDKPSLANAVTLVAGTRGVERIRLGSLEPRVATDAFVADIAKLPQLCPQFHLALQSGSDAVLQRMKRGYNTTQFFDAAQRIRSAYPNAAFTTDVIVGFPGETEAEFEETENFCEKIGFAKIHVFPFSPREGTPAAIMEDQIPDKVKENRVHRLIALGDQLAETYRRGMVGTVHQVLLEEQLKNGEMVGYTPEYIHVQVEGGKAGTLVNVRLTELAGEGMKGVIVE